MSWQDIVNGAFEASAGLFLFNNVRLLWKHKKISGVSVLSTAVFTAWGYWNLYYYPHLNQMMSFLGGIGVVAANTMWVILAIRYKNNG